MILITGATGFVGSRLVARLAEEGGLRCLVRRSPKVAALEPYGVELAYGDVTDPASVRAALVGVDTVVHLAAIIREQGRYTFESVNYRGSRDLIQASVEAGVKRFVFMSNLGAGPKPEFPFLLSKWMAEEELKKSGLAYTILRPSIIFGRGDEFITTLARVVERPPTGWFFLLPIVPIIGSGTVRFQTIWVEDVVTCLVQLLQREDVIGQTYEVGGPEHLTYNAVVDTIIDVLGVRRWKVHVPLWLMAPVVWLMERILSHPPITSHQLSMIRIDNITEPNAVETNFGFAPLRLKDGIDYIREV